MDQKKIGAFLKELRKEKELTQEQFAEKLNVSGRTVSRWETGSNMPDIGMLVEIADFYDVSIPEIMNGERKSENMDQETRDTAVAMAEYSRNEVKTGKQKISGILMSAFGIFIIVSALAIFPSDSSWGSTYAIFGSLFLVAGIYLMIRPMVAKRSFRILIVLGCMVLLFGAFTLSDYIAVTQFHQVPRFRYETSYDSRNPDQLVYKTIFFTAVRKNPGTKEEQVFIGTGNSNQEKSWSEQDIISMFSRVKEAHWEYADCVLIPDHASNRIGAVLFWDDKKETSNVAFFDADGYFQQCGAYAKMCEEPDFTYLGDGSVTFKLETDDGTIYHYTLTISLDGSSVNYKAEDDLPEGQ